VKKTHVLLIDDQRDLLAAVQELLETHGMEVLAGSSCADAERLWKTSRPDLAILDYLLPDGNAISLIQKFKDSDPAVPIIVLTGHGTIERAVEAVKTGAENLLPKPVNPSVLLDVIDEVLRTAVIARIALLKSPRGSAQRWIHSWA